MTLTPATAGSRLGHVRWIAGGTGAGKSTLTDLLARRFGALAYRGDRAEHDWAARCTPREHPRLAALASAPGEFWAGRRPEEVLAAMPSLYGETTGFLVEDLLALPGDRTVLADWFGILPGHLAPLLTGPHQAVFLLPTPEFRRGVLTARYADPDRARATWGSHDPGEMLAKRLARDELWDREISGQAAAHGLRTIRVDGAVPVEELADEVAAHLRLA